jgi:hypothetical protein
MKVLTAPWRLYTWLYENHPKQTVAAILLLVALSAAASGYANVALGQSNANNAVTSCENANESRQASRTLWYFVVNLAAKSAPPERVAYLGEVREWIGEVYKSHDCSDLSRSYPLPPPPVLPVAP